MKNALVALLRWLIALAMPVFIVLALLRILWNPWFVRWEYSKPDFPPDSYGFTATQRLEYTLGWVNYYNSTEAPEVGIKPLEALRVPGTDRPLYDPGEIGHMVDVRRVLDALWRVLAVAAIVIAGGLAVLLASRRTRRDGYAALFVGGVISTGLLVFFILFVSLSWRTFFVTLHDVFFPPGTWTFDYSSSLIRLFPDKFWFDGALLLVGAALALSALVLLAGYLLGRRGRVRRGLEIRRGDGTPG